jgi:hypothetical protein
MGKQVWSDFDSHGSQRQSPLSLLLIAAYSRPFTGEISVGSELLKHVTASESEAIQP